MMNEGGTVSASALALASSSFRFASSWEALDGVLAPEPAPFALALFFASLASFSSCLMRFIRGSWANVLSTRVRSRAVSSFFLRARSDLFFFSV